METKFHLDNFYVNEPILFGDMLLYQLGRAHFKPASSTNVHAHLKWYELTVVTGGEGYVSTNGVTLPVQKGDIYLSFPGDFHCVISSKDSPLKYDFFAFYSNNEMIEEELKKYVLTSHSYEQRILRNERIQSALSDAIYELTEKANHYEEILSDLFRLILSYLIRETQNKQCAQTQTDVTITAKIVFQIMHYIDTHIYELENLTTELSKAFNYNYSYLSAAFKRITGDTIFSYYQIKRLEAAKILLKTPNIRIIEVAEILKYSSPYSFSKAFKEKYGISPKFYQKGQVKI